MFHGVDATGRTLQGWGRDESISVKLGAWVHNEDGAPLAPHFHAAAAAGLSFVRCYHLGYAEAAAGDLRAAGLSLVGGMHFDASALLDDWRSQLNLDELTRYHDLGIHLDALCLGNELREGGDDPYLKRFSPALTQAMLRVLDASRNHLATHGFSTPLTCALEGTVYDLEGQFHPWVLPLLDAVDVVALNLYPMDNDAWFTTGAFEENRRLLEEPMERRRRFEAFERRLRRILAQLGKPVWLSETGFPSAVAFHQGDGPAVLPVHNVTAYGSAMDEFVDLLHAVSRDVDGRLQAACFYEWRDNPCHRAIWGVPPSPIHAVFGLCDQSGIAKFDLRRLHRP